MAFNESKYFWTDRTRYMGMPLSFTRYSLSEDRLFMSVGLFSVKDEEILLYRVRDISVQRTLWQRLFGVGTITISSSDKSTPIIVLKNIKDPLAVKELIHENVEENKINRRIRLGEIVSIGDSDDELDPDFSDDGN